MNLIGYACVNLNLYRPKLFNSSFEPIFTHRSCVKKTFQTKGFDYVSRLIGKIQFKTQGTHPLNANYHQGAIPPVPRYRGYKLFNGTPEFIYTFGPYTVHERVTPSGNKAVLFDYSIRDMQNDSLIRFGLDPAIRPSVESSTGHWEGNELLLTAEEARKFQLVLRYD